MELFSGIVLASGAEAACAPKNGLAVDVEGIDFSALLAGLAGQFENTASNAANSPMHLLPQTFSQQAAGKDSLGFPGALRAPETPGAEPVCQTGRPEWERWPFWMQELMRGEEGTEPALCAPEAAVQAAGGKATRETAVSPLPIQDSNSALLSPKRPDVATNEAKPVFEEWHNATYSSFSLHFAKPFAGAERTGGGENLWLSLSDAEVLPAENVRPLARSAAPSDLPVPDRSKAVPAAPDFRVRVAEVAPQGTERVPGDAETGWNKEVPAPGRSERVPLEELPQRFFHEVARRITDLQERRGVVRLQLQLDPPQLGSVAVKLTLSEHKLKVHFYAPDAEVKDLLVTTLPDLKAELGRMGLNLNEAHVFAGQEHGREPEEPPRREGCTQAPAVPVQVPEEITLATEGIDLLV